MTSSEATSGAEAPNTGPAEHSPSQPTHLVSSPVQAGRRHLERVVVVSGLSGAGKSQALKVLEDLGFFCIDNLPLPLLQGFLDYCRDEEKTVAKVAIGMDVRAGKLEHLPLALEGLRDQGHPLELLFLEADDKTLFTRFRENRRPHPLDTTGVISELIQLERQALKALREGADWIVDTSHLSIHELRRRLVQHYVPGSVSAPMQLTLLSFGYRYGLPFEADLVFDVRFLPNPHFVAELRPLDGRDARVSGYVFEHAISQEFLNRLEQFILFLLPQYQREGKAFLTIGIGCTGGKHRSVALVEALRRKVVELGMPVEVRHRDVGG